MNVNLIRAHENRVRAFVCAAWLVVAAAFQFATASIANAAPTLLFGDYNEDGIVSHADYSVLGDYFDTNGPIGDGNGDSIVNDADYAIYLANYGQTASSPSTLPLSITSSSTLDGNVLWTFSFPSVSGALAGHFSIRVDGPNAPNILSVTEGPLMKDSPSGFSGVPGASTFTWLSTTDVGGGNMRPIGGQSDNTAHEAYAAFGTTLGQSFDDDPLILFTLVTEGQKETTVRLLSGFSAPSTRFSEYGYGGVDYYFTEDQIATFVPEPSAAVLVLMGVAAGRLVGRRWRRVSR